MAARSEQTGRVSDPRALLDVVETREALCSTGIPGGLAFFHSRSQESYLRGQKGPAKPHQSHILGIDSGVQSHLKATLKPHQGSTKAPPRPHQSHTKATPKPDQSHLGPGLLSRLPGRPRRSPAVSATRGAHFDNATEGFSLSPPAKRGGAAPIRRTQVKKT
jgi:hypothetical protein